MLNYPAGPGTVNIIPGKDGVGDAPHRPFCGLKAATRPTAVPRSPDSPQPTAASRPRYSGRAFGRKRKLRETIGTTVGSSATPKNASKS